MSLAWIVEECATPFGPVRTFNWGVPDDDGEDTKKDARDYDKYDDGENVGYGDLGDDGHHFNANPDEIALEPAQDQLGSVLWNSNTVALDHFCRFVVAQENRDQNGGGGGGSPSPSSKTKKHRAEGVENSEEERTAPKKKEKDVGAAASLTAEELDAAKAVLSTKTVLELGSGVGVLGIALSLFGGAKAAITDIKELVPLMEKNIKESAKKVIALPPLPSVPTSTPATQAANQNSNKNNNGGKKNNKGGGGGNNNKSGRGGGGAPSTSNFATTIEGRGAKDAPFGERGGVCRAYSFRWGEPMPNPLREFLGARTQYIVMCDALYGNPSEWPKLIQNLKEIVAIAKASIAEDNASSSASSDEDEKEEERTAKKSAEKVGAKRAASSANTNEEREKEKEAQLGAYTCLKSEKLPIIVNYCEQRVEQVEGAFLKLLKETIPEWKIVGPSPLEAQSGMGMEVRVTAIYTR